MKKKLSVQLLSLASCVMGLAVLSLVTSCVSTTAPDGTEVKRVDQEAVNPWLELARDLFQKDQPPVPEILLDAK